jgi:anaerobic dimethyl sulfoxide reductase subunit B (iron-sulfur subunit)
MTQYAFYVNTASCTGCKSCQVACQDKNDLPAAMLWRRVLQYGGGSWEKKGASYVPIGVFRYYVSVACNHCAAPACMAACPVGAIAKDPNNGIVTIDGDACIGCRACEDACPYGAPVFDEVSGIERKCDMCADYVSWGKRPMCVDACPQRVMDFGEIEALRAKYPGTSDALEPLPLPTTAPSLLLRAHKDAQASGQGSGHVLNMPEEL